MHRGELSKVLADGVDIRFGAQVSGLEQDEGGVRVALADGRELEAEALTGADGIHSAVRTALFGELPRRYAGYTC